MCLRENSRFSTPGFRYTAKWKAPSGKTDSLRFPSRLGHFDIDTCCEFAMPRGSFVEAFDSCFQEIWKKREKFLVMGLPDVLRNLKLIFINTK